MPLKITFGYSPCPNDTFSFHALTHGLVDTPGFEINPFLADVEVLNQRALRGQFELSKLSFHALGHLLDKYALLRSGSALGRGCGPLLVAKPGKEPRNLAEATFAVPGMMTTAHMLLGLYLGCKPKVRVMEFSQIMDAVAKGHADAGLIIHEGRFTYEDKGLTALLDLGEWWEQETSLPIPLGCIAIRRDMGAKAASSMQNAIAESISLAWSEPERSRNYVMEHAQEMDPAVVKQHIGLYVNHFSIDLGDEGIAAVKEMLERGRKSTLIPSSQKSLFLPGG